MKSVGKHFYKNLAILVGSTVLLVLFQNCAHQSVAKLQATDFQANLPYKAPHHASTPF